jgi:hypothetical protein
MSSIVLFQNTIKFMLGVQNILPVTKFVTVSLVFYTHIKGYILNGVYHFMTVFKVKVRIVNIFEQCV